MRVRRERSVFHVSSSERCVRRPLSNGPRTSCDIVLGRTILPCTRTTGRRQRRWVIPELVNCSNHTRTLLRNRRRLSIGRLYRKEFLGSFHLRLRKRGDGLMICKMTSDHHDRQSCNSRPDPVTVGSRHGPIYLRSFQIYQAIQSLSTEQVIRC